jgi:prolipoprotein diacylglyceryltransferase
MHQKPVPETRASLPVSFLYQCGLEGLVIAVATILLFMRDAQRRCGYRHTMAFATLCLSRLFMDLTANPTRRIADAADV